MDISKALSKMIGMYYVIISTAMFINLPQFMVNINKLINDEPLMFVTGFFTLILGVIVVVIHNVWEWNWRAIITIIAWLTLIKGTSIILFPHFLDNTTLMFTQNFTIAYIAAGLDFCLGLLLCYFGFRRS